MNVVVSQLPDFRFVLLAGTKPCLRQGPSAVRPRRVPLRQEHFAQPLSQQRYLGHTLYIFNVRVRLAFLPLIRVNRNEGARSSHYCSKVRSPDRTLQTQKSVYAGAERATCLYCDGFVMNSFRTRYKKKRTFRTNHTSTAGAKMVTASVHVRKRTERRERQSQRPKARAWLCFAALSTVTLITALSFA